MAAASMKSMSACELHEKEEVRFYCEDCQVMICDDCIVGGHRNHKSVKLKEYGAKRRDAILKTTDNAENTKIPNIQSSIQLAKDRQENFSESVKKETDCIKQKRKLMDTILDELQSELIESLTEADDEAQQLYNRFVRSQESKISKINQIVDDMKTKGTDLTDMEAARYNVRLEELLKFDPYTDTVPNPQPPRYQFNEAFVNKEKLQTLIGFIESDSYATVGLDESPDIRNAKHPDMKEEEKGKEYYNEPTDSPQQPYTKLIANPKLIFQTIKSVSTENSISCIVPKEEALNAWIIDKHITELDCSNTEVNPKLLKNLDQQVISACSNKKNDLLVGFQNKLVLKQLQLSTNKITKRKSYSFVSSFNITPGNSSLACICKSQVSAEQHIACLQEKAIPANYLIRWFTNGKASDEDLSLSSSYIEISSPVQICQNADGHICILCRPDIASWIVVLDRNGKQILRYPVRESEESKKVVDFVGVGFLKDKTITISDRASREQLLVDYDGNCIQRDTYDVEPTCCAVDRFHNVWVGFEGGTVKIIKYKHDHEYAEVKIDTQF